MKIMKTISVKQPINLKVVKFEVDFGTLLPQPESPIRQKRKKVIKVPNINCTRKRSLIPPTPAIENFTLKRKDVKELVEELLDDLYSDQRTWSTSSRLDYRHGQGSTSGASWASSQSNCGEHIDEYEHIDNLGLHELQDEIAHWQSRLQETGKRLARNVRIRDRLRRQQRRLSSAFTILLRNITGDPNVRFGVSPGAEGPGEGGYTEWLHAMRLVARLPAGVPQHFRKKLWLSLSDRHLSGRGVDWPVAERACFTGTAQPDDTELGAQILKDLHRTGCSLFCGTEGRENQAMLRRVLLAYARWNKDVGYCQGFNMLAAIILEVMDKSESDSLKVMIYLVEAVLPEGYFADDLRGLSADMAAFRDLLRLRLPRLANHMDHLQRISDGGGVEPPLPDVFTMQWFLTLYATWLQRDCLLRIWDLVMLDGNEVLLLTALAIWDMLQDRILSARSADEFYSCMGGGAGAVWEAGESLVVRVVSFGSAPELPRLRNIHRYRVAPPAPPAVPSFQPPLHSAMQTMTKRGLRLFYSEDEGDSSDDGNKLALATIIPRREDRLGTGDRLSLDIGALKRQYARLRERQRQAHVILAAACARHAAVGVSTSPTSLTVNNLLLGKSAIVSSRGRRLGPPPGAVPPSRQTSLACDKTDISSQEQSSDTISWSEEKSRKTLSRRNSVKWKDIKKPTYKPKVHKEKTRKASIDFDETGDGIIVSEREANEMIASLRSRSSSESSSYSSKSASSTDTSLCDENERDSESEIELQEQNKQKHVMSLGKKISPLLIPMESQIPSSPLKETKITTSPVESKLVVYDEGKKVEAFQNITEYLDTAAGEPLRIYIDGFESKLRDSYIVNSDEKKQMPSPLQNSSPISSYFYPAVKNELDKINLHSSKEESKSVGIASPIKLTALPKKITDLSPIELSPGNFDNNHKSCDYDFKSNVIRPVNYPSVITRPPDIIDAFAMNPNFVPDIDLSDKYVSDVDSPPRSPGAESIVVSEDEPPIPLKIDKYFEHSPEFFGARVTDPNNLDIPNRRATKRLLRTPKKPDSLTLQSSHDEKTTKIELERASSLPQSHSFRSADDVKKLQIDTTIGIHSETNDPICTELFQEISPVKSVDIKSNSPKDYIHRFGRKNSERALQIIQENSKILSRILTKQSAAEKSKPPEFKSIENISEEHKNISSPTITREPLPLDSLNLKESTSDTIIGYGKLSTNNDLLQKTGFVKVRPISIDDPFSLESNDSFMTKNKGFASTSLKLPRDVLEIKKDGYDWESKGFLVKSDHKSILESSNDIEDRTETKIKRETELNLDINPITNLEYSKYSSSVTQPSLEPKDSFSFDSRMSFEENNYQFSNKYNDFVLSTARDICNKSLQEDQTPKVSDLLSKTENSQATDFAHLVTSSISFTYEPSVDDDSPMGAKSNSSDTLCQITSLDQVSTPISPKLFPNKETPTLPKDFCDKIEKVRDETEDTCSTITSLMETDTISSISYPRSPSTGSYHPFPTRPSLRMPKELGVRLGMYPKDTINSPTK